MAEGERAAAGVAVALRVGGGEKSWRTGDSAVEQPAIAIAANKSAGAKSTFLAFDGLGKKNFIANPDFRG
ncbi:MAG: hypothetical protein ACREPG_06320 [Candidatus Binatia bacterium]